MELFSAKQKTINLQSGVTFSSDFQSGNLGNAQQKEPNFFHIWIQADPHSTYRTWFYFSVEGIPQGATATFCIVNMSNQVKLFREGHLPVFKDEKDRNWGRIKLPLQQNGIGKGEQGFQLTFKHTFTNKTKHYFAFTYPWTHSENNVFIRSLVDNFKNSYFCDYRKLCVTTKKVQVNLLTLTKIIENNTVEIKEFKKIEQFQAYTFKNKRGIFISSRVHPGEVASSHMLNGILKYLFSNSSQAQKLLENFVFYIVPMVNPDGVIDGNFRCDSLGKNLNRFYSDPSPKQQPEIFGLKQFLLEMINSKLIHFCLDLHSHVNKQGVFMYGNSTNSLREQLAVCLYPKLLEYNCKYFDYEACNFSQKNMSSKDKGDDLSKEGASRVAIYKQTGLVSCWTLQCNYNSCKTINILPKPEEQLATKGVSNGMITDPNYPTKKQEVVLLNVEQFEQIGANIAETLLDYYKLRKTARYFGSKLKNASNFQLNLSVNILRMIPFKFDNECRKIINAINSAQCLNQNYSKILERIGLDPVAQYLSTKALRQKSTSKQKTQKVESKPQSLKFIDSKANTQATIVSKEKRETKVKSVVQKQKERVAINKVMILTPNIPNIPKMARKN